MPKKMFVIVEKRSVGVLFVLYVATRTTIGGRSIGHIESLTANPGTRRPFKGAVGKVKSNQRCGVACFADMA